MKFELNPIKIFRKNFLTGIFVLIPLAVIVWILAGALDLVWNLIDLLPPEWSPNAHFSSTTASALNLGIALALSAVLGFIISVIGFFSKFYLGQRVLIFLGEVIQHIPVVGAIYSSLDQLLKTLSKGGSKQFNRVVYLEYPRKGVWAIGFVTGEARAQNLGDQYLNVFVPTVPNPTSGFHLIVPVSEVKETGMRVDEAFKTILSLGIAQP